MAGGNDLKARAAGMANYLRTANWRWAALAMPPRRVKRRGCAVIGIIFTRAGAGMGQPVDVDYLDKNHFDEVYIKDRGIIFSVRGASGLKSILSTVRRNAGPPSEKRWRWRGRSSTVCGR